MDSELEFEWPDSGRALPEEWRPLARRKTASPPKPAPPLGPDGAEKALADAQGTIARLEADRRAARTLIEDLETANKALEARVTSQRRRLLLLERQLEGADVQPAWETESSVSWLDRLFGGLSSVSTG